MAETSTAIGHPLRRVDGLLKVTGGARYAGEYPADDLLYGFVVSSAIAKGRIAAIDTIAARAVAGVVEVITHENRAEVAKRDKQHRDGVAPPGSPLRPLQDETIYFSGQPVALVVAETFEAAREAAALVRVQYAAAPHNTRLEVALAERFMPSKKRAGFKPPESRGHAEDALAAAPLQIAADYRLAVEHHNPLEMHASTVIWEGEGKLTVYDKTQGSQNVQAYLAGVFGLSPKALRVLNPFVGGAFGSGLRPQYQVYLAVLAATMLERSVRVTLTRQQMFTHSHRPQCVQSVSLGANEAGQLVAIRVDATTATSRFENYMETVVNWGATAYACENAQLGYAIAPLDIATPGDMRAPGAATGMTFFEMAMDELAYAAGIDPLQLRKLNHSDEDAMSGKPYTSKALLSAYAQGAERFGWSERNHAPRSMREGRERVGWGMATGIWEATMNKTAASATLYADGRLEVASASSDIGTGTYTIMTQIAADTLGVAVDRVTAKLGDSDLPACPVEGGSWTAASLGAAVQLACRALAAKLWKLARKVEGKPLGAASLQQVEFAEGSIRVIGDPARAVPYAAILSAAGVSSLEANQVARPDLASNKKKARNAHSAVFAEVKVDEELGVVRVTRIVAAVAAGRIINPRTARSQILGGVVMAMGMALYEETAMDHRLGRFMNHNLADYHVPAHADVHDIEVVFVDEPDPEINPLGVKGVGEIGIVGTAAAIANAIFHATGKRVRSLPITIDKLLERG
jgi:xanthine dehydrogenase YagR molybdenum-binding subunit